jgi:hypothetical protein
MKNNSFDLKSLDNMTSESSRWLLNRYDNWRASIATRCSIVLSADAILLAGETILLENILNKKLTISHELLIILGLLIIVSMLLLILSLFYSTIGIANVFKSSRRSFAKATPNRLLFHPSDVVGASKNFEEFYSKFSNITQNEVNLALWSEIWSLVFMHNQRYQRLKRAISFLVFSLPIYMIVIVLILINAFCT